MRESCGRQLPIQRGAEGQSKRREPLAKCGRLGNLDMGDLSLSTSNDKGVGRVFTKSVRNCNKILGQRLAEPCVLCNGKKKKPLLSYYENFKFLITDILLQNSVKKSHCNRSCKFVHLYYHYIDIYLKVCKTTFKFDVQHI